MAQGLFQMPKKIAKGFTILELLVVLAVMGVFAVVAYPNISKWIIDREVKKEVYDVVEFIKERKSEIDNGQYGMTQILLNRQMEVFTMSQEDFVYKYKSISSPNTSFKKNRTCGFAHNGGFKILELSLKKMFVLYRKMSRLYNMMI